jgi:hypothetical protein
MVTLIDRIDMFLHRIFCKLTFPFVFINKCSRSGLIPRMCNEESENKYISINYNLFKK